MTEFDQQGQVVWGSQQNAGRDIHNIFPAAAWTPPVMLPPRAQSFVGRDEDLAWLLQQLRSEAGVTLALCGPGGMGKTALAAEALSRLVAQSDWLTRFPGGIFYHSFYTSPSLAAAFEELARLLEEEPAPDPRRAAVRALSRRRTILAFDGVEVLEDTFPLRDLGGMHIVLLLSRRHSDAPPDLAYRRTLDLLSPNQAILLLQKLAGPHVADRQSVERLVQHIGGYPLALQIIGSYLLSRQEEVADYLQWFEEEGLVALHQGEHQRQSVTMLLRRTYAALTDTEQAVFLLLGMLAPAPFPMELVQGILGLPERGMRQALGSLINLSVLRCSEQVYEASHPLVHTFAKELISSQGKAPSFSNTIAIWQDRLVTMLATHFGQSNPYDSFGLSLWLPHTLALLSATYPSGQQNLKAAYLFNAIGFDAITQGQYAQAEPFFLRALALRQQQLGTMHPETAQSINSLASLYEHQGNLEQAELLYLRALSINEHMLGTKHPDTAQSLNNLALLYQHEGKYTEAEPLYLRALSIKEQALGDKHPSMATGLNNLASLYSRQGKFALAEPLYRRAMMICEQVLGTEHPDTANTIYNLALLYLDQGKFIEAEPLLVRALAICEQVLGAENPNTASCILSLANLYENQGRYELVEPLLMRALEIYEQRLGTEHPETGSCLNSLALFYLHQGKYTEAEPLLMRAMTICEQQLGAEHPNTAQSLGNLAILYYKQEKYAKAEPLLVQALQIKERHLGTTHFETAQTLNNLALLYLDQRKFVEAEPLLIQALTISEQMWGAEHPNTAIYINNLAEFYREQGKYAESEPLYQRALAICEHMLGLNHPSTQTVRKNYTILLRAMDHDEEDKQREDGG